MKSPGLLLTVALAVDLSLNAFQTSRPPHQFELRAESPQFWKLLAKDADLTVVATGFGFTEGPVWDPAGFLYVSDEELNKIFRI